MTDEAFREEIKACIAFYEERGYNWAPAVCYLAFRHHFGSLPEFISYIRKGMRPYNRRTDEKKSRDEHIQPDRQGIV